MGFDSFAKTFLGSRLTGWDRPRRFPSPQRGQPRGGVGSVERPIRVLFRGPPFGDWSSVQEESPERVSAPSGFSRCPSGSSRCGGCELQSSPPDPTVASPFRCEPERTREKPGDRPIRAPGSGGTVTVWSWNRSCRKVTSETRAPRGRRLRPRLPRGPSRPAGSV